MTALADLQSRVYGCKRDLRHSKRWMNIKSPLYAPNPHPIVFFFWAFFEPGRFVSPVCVKRSRMLSCHKEEVREHHLLFRQSGTRLYFFLFLYWTVLSYFESFLSLICTDAMARINWIHWWLLIFSDLTYKVKVLTL